MPVPRDTATLIQNSNAHDGPGPRKRRKRAPAAGAADDCFTCSSQNVQCDRRRPYCSRCLDAGKDCSGYKTQLTWGIGVASRGKLRGLSLPIAGTQKIERQSTTTKQKKRVTNITLPPASNIATAHVAKSVEINQQVAAKLSGLPMDPQNVITSTTFDAVRWHISNAEQAPRSGDGNGSNASSLGVAPNGSDITATLSPPKQIDYTYQDGPNATYTFSDQQSIPPLSYSASSQASLFLEDSMTPRTVANTRSLPNYSTLSNFPVPFGHPFSHPQFHSLPRQDESYVRNDDFDPSLRYGHQHLHHSSGEHLVQLDGFLPRQEEDIVKEIIRDDSDPECAVLDDMSVGSGPLSLDYRLILSPFAAAAGIGKTPRMQYLINYYTEVISPVIVAFDGPNNPWRNQILRLAAESETLQHAISALSASNLRQRRETGALSTGKTDPARRSSMAHLSLTDETWQNLPQLTPQEQAREETYHKGRAIQSLNQQLAHPVLRKQDSILATLLMLCMFHMCDSGIAKFQTQFAGVKKLLTLRSNEFALHSSDTKWLTRIFTWFDAMTATVNDREGQIQGGHLETSALSDEEWALENLAGCDGQLFKTVAKLGRLNLLSQGKSVEANPTIVPSPLPGMSFFKTSYGDFDGNGWMRVVQDESLFSEKTACPDVQTQFWREWREIRQTLQTWQLNYNHFDGSNLDAPLLTPEQKVDLGNISESFRYSALLYTERLANPSAPSATPSIQAWVRQSLNYIRQVKSDVYLLWPLFITGSECVNESDRGIIRERCLDIQKDSGFMNNKSCLELLEKVWVANPGGFATNAQGQQLNGFRFREIMMMEENEGEYIVV